jgi:hypothetical protein
MLLIKKRKIQEISISIKKYYFFFQFRKCDRGRVGLCVGRLDPSQRRLSPEVDVEALDDVPGRSFAGDVRRRDCRRLRTSR